MSAPVSILVLDVETTGLAPPAEVVQIGATQCTLDGAVFVAHLTFNQAYAPRNGNPPEARAIHHLGPADFEGTEPCDEQTLCDTLTLFGRRPDFVVAHSWAMEGQWFTPEILGGIPTICTLKAASRIWPDAPGFGNQVLRYWLEDQGRIHDLGSMAQPAHSAGPDTFVTAHTLRELLKHATLAEMSAWTAEPRVMPKINFGKHRGSQWADAPADYLSWVAGKSELDADTKWNAQRELDRRAAR